ncbi:hypothetical protein EYB26_001156 [Talaromyces marneffei]|uniref:Putative transcriptional regulatory protein C15D4.02 n=1 Tax=Talaromyces marneffei PM1 TaxID=1077442 RepID=A0A093VMB1_TALMA|nr:uncharacterized protein EYB26_001156 [Talaromyces marneffei]QGA13506.1 hypothetical protein EYB26_001156 [Talaromyces marneffei]
MENKKWSPPAQQGVPETGGGIPTPKETTLLRLSQQRRPRTSTEKVRTGCITCKRRHIKCDEAKPHCNNCLKSRGHCEGYASGGNKKTKPSGPAQIIWNATQVVPAVGRTVPLYIQPDSPHSHDGDADMRYFDEFIAMIQAPWATAASNGDLWTSAMPQLAHGTPTLRYAAMAIGALSKWIGQTKSGLLRVMIVPSTLSTQADTHYFNAVAYYCRALRLQNQQASLQDAVFLSVLLLFFEVLRGNRKAALDHINHGLALLLILTTDDDTQNHVAKFAPNPLPVISSVADVFTYLAPQARLILRGKFGHSPPALPNFLKGLKKQKQTMESFMVLLSQVSQSSPIMDRIPTSFTSLDEFEQLWISFQREQTAIGLIMEEIIHETKTVGTTTEEFPDTFHLKIIGDFRIREFCAGSREVLEAFERAFLPLFDKIMMSDPESATYLRAIHLRLQHLGMYIFVNPPIFLDMELLQAQTPSFREYLSLAEVLLRTARRQSKNPAHQLSLQCVLAMHLLTVAMHCRDPLVREQAVWMLRDYPGQDGLFNTHAMYAIAVKNRTVESKNATEGTPDEQLRRLWRREFIFEDGGDRVVFRYMDKDDGANAWHLVEEVADVQNDIEDMEWTQRVPSASVVPLIIDLYST